MNSDARVNQSPDHSPVESSEMIRRYLHCLESLRAQCDALKRTPPTLIAVSKTQSVAAIECLAAVGHQDFGENYVQEAIPKIAALAHLNLTWHFLGPIQSNKTAAIAQNFDWVHSVSRLDHAQRLSRQRPANLPPLQVCLQVNTSGEASKSGVSPAEVLNLAQAVAILPNLKLRGLMTIPTPISSNQRVDEMATALNLEFLTVAKLITQLNEQLNEQSTEQSTEQSKHTRADHDSNVGFKQSSQPNLKNSTTVRDLDTLSMGMSDDWLLAVAAGSTHVRIGTAIFGRREPKTH